MKNKANGIYLGVRWRRQKMDRKLFDRLEGNKRVSVIKAKRGGICSVILRLNMPNR